MSVHNFYLTILNKAGFRKPALQCIAHLLFLLAPYSNDAVAQTDIDKDISTLVKHYHLTPLKKLASRNEALYNAGSRLFSDTLLSGNRNISCQSCHSPDLGTSDGLSLSLGQGKNTAKTANGTTHPMRQGKAAVLRRNSSALFNLGQTAATHMFWDSRVRFKTWGDIGYITPEPNFNGSQPVAAEIVKVLKRAVDMQALFPMLEADEMRGKKGENELANARSNLELWNAIVNRIKRERPDISQQLVTAFQLPSTKELHIGHIGAAIGEFVTYRFQATNTAYDRYLSGETNALSERQKQGLLVFLDKGKCVFCHSGPLLSNNVALNTGIPLIKIAGKELDKGVGSLSKDEREDFQFRTPPLRNSALSAPYMHNGAFSNLKDVIDHYDNIFRSLDGYQSKAGLFDAYSTKITVEKNPRILETVYNNISPLVESPLFLSSANKDALLDFLVNGLTDQSFLIESAH